MEPATGFLERGEGYRVFYRIWKDAAVPSKVLCEFEHFQKAVTAVGITDQSRVVVYDGSEVGCFSAFRVWWLFRYIGFDNVSVLNGGLPVWTSLGLPVESGPVKPVPSPLSSFSGSVAHPEMVASIEEVRQFANKKGGRVTALADARPPPRFHGSVPEPRPGILRGHVAGAKNMPRGKLLDKQGLKTDPSAAKAAWESCGLDVTAPGLCCNCGSGVTSCVLIASACVASGLPVEAFGLFDLSTHAWLNPEDAAINPTEL
ncbi:hypothetical protein KIPB_000088 [Kipferlia bialata]|uniref:Rhodanese domain-containing protein n=1 Tax=Kipferlia bialata TaxID=797122 RepID=A0A9K3CLJ3_9EUKA|nr:hypothetical protein KIPB_000088 [Kipferlia bialata]|eukprot:g88.t1